MAKSFTSIFTSGIRPATVDFRGVLFIANGREWMRCTPDGMQLFYVNPAYPINNHYEKQSVAVTNMTGGNLTGDYRWYYAWYNKALGYYSLPGAASKDGEFQTLSGENGNIGSGTAADAFMMPTYTWYNSTTGWGMLDVLGSAEASEIFKGIAHIKMYRNIAGATSSDYVNNTDRIPYFGVPWNSSHTYSGEINIQNTALTIVDDTIDGALEFTNQLNYGAVPPPLCKYIWMHNGRLCGVGFDPIILQNPVTVDHSLSKTYRSNDYRYSFLPADSSGPIEDLPDGLTPWTPNMAIEILSGNLKGYVADAVFTEDLLNSGGNYYYPIKMDVNNDSTGSLDGTYQARIVERTPGVWYYSQQGQPFYFGDPITGVLNQEPYKLYQGDTPRGGASIGSANLVFGLYSTSVSVNIGSEDIPQWITGTIAGGVISHWTAVSAGKYGLVALSTDGPVTFQPPTRQQVQGGYFGEWLPLDKSEDGHRKCARIFKNNIDLTDFDYFTGIYSAADNIVEWSVSTKDRVDGTHGNLQIQIDLNTGNVYLMDGRFKNAYMIGSEEGKPVIVHGDDWGIMNKDYVSTYDGDADIDESDADKQSIRDVDSYSTSVSLPNYLGVSTGDVVQVGGDELGIYPDIAGTLVFAVNVVNGIDVPDFDDWRIVIDFKYASSVNYLYLYEDKDWANATYVHSDGNSRAYPEKVMIGGIYAWCDTPAIGASGKTGTIRGATIRLIPLEDANGNIQIGGFRHLDDSSIVAQNDKYEVPTTTGRQRELLRYHLGIARGETTQIKLLSIGTGYKFACKEITFDVGLSNDE